MYSAVEVMRGNRAVNRRAASNCRWGIDTEPSLLGHCAGEPEKAEADTKSRERVGALILFMVRIIDGPGLVFFA